jgi:hypothetical protein
MFEGLIRAYVEVSPHCILLARSPFELATEMDGSRISDKNSPCMMQKKPESVYHS